MSRWIKLLLSLAITVLAGWATLRGTDWGLMWASLRYANWFVLASYLLVLVVVHFARTLRWGNLLSAQEHVPFKPLNEASAIGFMMLVILPFRLGEFARPFLIAQRSSIRRSVAMTSVVFERIVDGVAVAALLLVLLLFIPSDAPDVGKIRVGGLLTFAVFFGGFLFLLLARWQHDRVIAFLRALFGIVSKKVAEKVVHIVDGFVGALKQLPDRKNMALFLMWTTVYWVINGLGMALFANGLDCSGANGAACQPLHLTAFQGYVALGAVIVGMLIPAAPGSAGTFQYAITLALGLFMPQNVVKSAGAAFAWSLWIVQILQQIVTGLFFMVRSHLSFRDLAGKLSDQSQQASGV
ncbi:MAG: lysylphosphatidylglycerol synthase transmembrane domain-containing protein [Myxococcota bacterium]